MGIKNLVFLVDYRFGEENIFLEDYYQEKGIFLIFKFYGEACGRAGISSCHLVNDYEVYRRVVGWRAQAVTRLLKAKKIMNV